MEAEGRRTTGIGTALLAAVVMVIVVAAVASAFVIERSLSTQGTTGSSSSTSPGGLLLSVTVNSSSIGPGRGVAATVEDTDTLSTSLNMSKSSDWPLPGLAIGPCGTLNEPVGLLVLAGNFGITNASLGTPLSLYAPGPYACPVILLIQSYLFQPMSDNATIYASDCAPTMACASETVSATVSVRGYYSGGNLTSFPAGVYTVVAGDEWGDIAVSHFTVS